MKACLISFHPVHSGVAVHAPFFDDGSVWAPTARHANAATIKRAIFATQSRSTEWLAAGC